MSNVVQLINKEWEGKKFTFREDGYFNMTKAAKQFGKDLDAFRKRVDVQEYVQELENVMENPNSEGASELETKVIFANKGRYGGTWAHPKLAVFFARWLDVRFAVACDAMIEDILTGAAELDIVKPEESATLALPDTHIKAVEQLLGELKKNQLLTETNKELNIKLDSSKEYASIKKVKRAFPDYEFKWQDLKEHSTSLGIKINKVVDQNYGAVNTYHASVWSAVYNIDIKAIEEAA